MRPGDPDVPADVAGERPVVVPGRGVARSRNAAIDHAGRRYLLFCDDDVTVDLPGVLAAVDHLRETGAALALGRATNPAGRFRKRYARRARRLTLFSSAKAATYEMLVDVDQVRAAGLRFDERFGAGAQHHLGDEYLFVAAMLRAGLRADAVPITVAVHPAESSGSRWGGSDVRARAVVLNEVFGRWAAPVRLAFAVRAARRLGSLRAVAALAGDGTRAEPLSRATSSDALSHPGPR
ncbi:hypothetical protein GCM10025865_21840 [Paraoerskovia sediminicola]|uniref:Glycosyltransferase 2-like domain-containing protein n=1 Tax=Paraoerskovia sediminicola TaxID=1138587 RepID=A0ABN6XGF6_9CELL|nr:glycosyltransferase family A protein [Paraoerskovia sediminicola]BDZ42885.1 hypothetical protein GCM10025865_21840 [Paraoerskovia sediminicola]